MYIGIAGELVKMQILIQEVWLWLRLYTSNDPQILMLLVPGPYYEHQAAQRPFPRDHLHFQ